MLIVIAPLGEELLFRGILLRGFIPNYGSWKGIALGAALFAAMHIEIAKLFGTLVLGLVFGWWYARTRNIWMGVLGHLLNNGLVVVAIWIWPESLKAKAPAFSWFEPPLLLGSLLLFGFGIWLMQRLFARHSLEASS